MHSIPAGFLGQFCSQKRHAGLCQIVRHVLHSSRTTSIRWLFIVKNPEHSPQKTKQSEEPVWFKATGCWFCPFDLWLWPICALRFFPQGISAGTALAPTSPVLINELTNVNFCYRSCILNTHFRVDKWRLADRSQLGSGGNTTLNI